MIDWSLILFMALVTYLPRYLPLALAGKVKVPSVLEKALGFVPIAVLSAIIAQATFVRSGQLAFNPENLHAWSALVALLAALISRHLFVTIVSGLVCFVLLKLWY